MFNNYHEQVIRGFDEEINIISMVPQVEEDETQAVIFVDGAVDYTRGEREKYNT